VRENYHTHKVAVNAYLLKNDQFLLLKRVNHPAIWAPPGGRLNPDENPENGLRREIKEETNFDVEIVVPVNTWFGDWNGRPLLSIDYLAHFKNGELKLSHEHSDAAWVTIDELRRGEPIRLDPQLGFNLADFEKARKLALLLRSGW